MFGPCEWPVVFADCDGLPSLPDASAETIEQAQQMAVAHLWNWTGQRYGLCEETVRPCREGCGSYGRTTWQGTGAIWQPALIAGEWYNITCGICPPTRGGCTCGEDATTIRLPGPIASIKEILVDGVALDPSAYRVDNGSLLVRTDGEAWPVCQNLNAALTEPDTWAVTYLRGTPVPTGGQVAAGALAEEFAKALCGDASCQLPRRVQSITRQGVSMAILDAFEDIEKGHTGIWIVDSWVASVNASLNQRGGTVASPDIGRHRRSPATFRSTSWPSI